MRWKRYPQEALQNGGFVGHNHPSHNNGEIGGLQTPRIHYNAKGNSRHSDKHFGNMHHRMPPSTTGWPILNEVIFPPVMRLVLDTQNSDHPVDYIKFTS